MVEVNGITGVFSLKFVDDLALNVLILAIILAIVSLFIWEFYKSASKRNILNLNLNQYNQSDHPLFKKVYAVGFYLVEYLLITPVLMLLWFAALSFVLLLITEEGVSVAQLLMISAVNIGAVRILA